MPQLARAQHSDETTEQTWSGRADLLDANGVLIASVAAELWQLVQQGRGIQWGGHLEAPANAEPSHLPTAEYTYTLRLVDGREGRVTALGAPRIRLFAGPYAREELDVVGFGQPPF
ncbi:MAG: hypothetical protein O3A10_06980 [Chloroflexi bacterium]|nr:hypothetical protein [Chloroflexota bacterium]MDA1146048.1 hypothetical protein [Chloroflexota bacterium]